MTQNPPERLRALRRRAALYDALEALFWLVVMATFAAILHAASATCSHSTLT